MQYITHTGWGEEWVTLHANQIFILVYTRLKPNEIIIVVAILDL